MLLSRCEKTAWIELWKQTGPMSFQRHGGEYNAAYFEIATIDLENKIRVVLMFYWTLFFKKLTQTSRLSLVVYSYLFFAVIH